LAPVKPPIARTWELFREELRKPRKPLEILREVPPPEKAERAETPSTPATTGAPAFDLHEGSLPPEPPLGVKTPVEAYAAAATQSAAKGEKAKTDMATLLASTSGLRDAIILREIFGPPRGMQRLEEMRDSLARV
jgi:hypothetical protein